MAGLKKVVVLVAHADDELMAAGTIMKLINERDAEVHLIVGFYSEDSRSERKSELRACATQLGVVLHCKMIDCEEEFCWNKNWVEFFEPGITNIDPQLIISHRVEDNNNSHSHLGKIARTIARKNNISLWEMDHSIPGGIEPSAPANNYFVNISDYFYRKQKAIECYRSQMIRYRRTMYSGIFHRDRYLGAMISPEKGGVQAVEAFHIHKEIWM